MKTRTFRLLVLAIAMLLLLNACTVIPTVPPTTATTTNKSDPTTSQSTTSSTSSTTSSSTTVKEEPAGPDNSATPTIYLAGDSTVKTYEDAQFIAGWGQYLGLFLDGNVNVVNAAHGGRSSRSFINEGRLYNIDDPDYNYSFSQNGGNSIEDVIKEGDFLFIQFGHNDDASKLSNYSTIYDRMVPLGEPDENGIYPTTPAEKLPTNSLPEEYISAATDAEQTKALTELAKYGSEYYAYHSGGTYKWYLKQYIDFARSVGATPVLITPVARVKFSGGAIIGGAGLHGENFAYVEAVRQLAREEDCLLIDLFADSKAMLEAATSTYANYMMALKPNELLGTWPADYDNAYGNADAGYTGIEATHYNKYGSFVLAAFVAEHILTTTEETACGERFNFGDHVLLTPSEYIDPSNLMSKSSVAAVESLLAEINVTNPDRAYYDPQNVVELIEALALMGEVTADNLAEVKAACEQIRDAYAKVNVDDRALVTNLSSLDEYEAAIKSVEESLRPDPTRVVIFNADDLLQSVYNSTVTEGDFTFVATSDKTMEKKAKQAAFTYGGTNYSVANGLSVGGSAKFGTTRYVSFTVDGPCKITVAVQSSSKTDTRTLSLVNASGSVIGSYEAGVSACVSSIDVEEAGTYMLGSAGSGMYIFVIIIEYFN